MSKDELGLRARRGPLGIGPHDVRQLEPLATQTLTEAEPEQAGNLGKPGPSDVAGLTMTQCVPQQRA